MDARAWVSFVNGEAEALTTLASLSKNVLRGHLRDRLAEQHGFPLEVGARCLVVGERMIENAPAAEGGAVSVVLTRHLELVPEGLTRAAAALTGPFVVPIERALQEGSVVDIILLLEDPRERDLDVPGLFASVKEMQVQVPVER